MARFTAGGLTESDLAPPPSGGGDPGGQKITATAGSGASSANHRDAATTAPMTRAWRATERGRGIPPRVREVCLVDSIRFSSNMDVLPSGKTPYRPECSEREAACESSLEETYRLEAQRSPAIADPSPCPLTGGRGSSELTAES